MKIILRENLVHHLKDKWKKTNPVTFNIPCLKFPESYFILLDHFYYSHHPVSIKPNSLIRFVCLKARAPICLVIPIIIAFGWCIYSTSSIVKCSLREAHSRFCISSFQNQASLSLDHCKWLSNWTFLRMGLKRHTLPQGAKRRMATEETHPCPRDGQHWCGQLASERHGRGLGSGLRQV